MWTSDETWTSGSVTEKNGQLWFKFSRALDHTDPEQKLRLDQEPPEFKVGYVYGVPKFEAQAMSGKMMLKLDFAEV